MTKLRVLVVDDSVFYIHRISALLTESPLIEVVGTARNGVEAIDQVRQLNPDVVTMDVEMPEMDGITATRRIMATQPTRILMFSALTREGAKATLDALDAGAVDFLEKQLENFRHFSEDAPNLLVQRVLTVGRSKLPARSSVSPHGLTAQGRGSRTPLPSRGRREAAKSSAILPKLIAIGASTGGPVALQTLLGALPADFSLPLVIAVHMPANFTSAFADRLNDRCQIKVREAADGDLLERGLALLAPGGKQMLLQKKGDRTAIQIVENMEEQTYRPSVDVMLSSAAQHYPGRVLGIVLTGMGADGKQGAQKLKAGGSEIWTQDKDSCVVYGMPQAIMKAGLSDKEMPLTDIGPALRSAVCESII